MAQSTEFIGIIFDKYCKKWRAKIRFEDRIYHGIRLPKDSQAAQQYDL
jgi:hypothetical protein